MSEHDKPETATEAAKRARGKLRAASRRRALRPNDAEVIAADRAAFEAASRAMLAAGLAAGHELAAVLEGGVAPRASIARGKTPRATRPGFVEKSERRATERAAAAEAAEREAARDRARREAAAKARERERRALSRRCRVMYESSEGFFREALADAELEPGDPLLDWIFTRWAAWLRQGHNAIAEGHLPEGRGITAPEDILQGATALFGALVDIRRAELARHRAANN